MHTKIINGEVGAWVEMMPIGIGGLRGQVLALDPDSDFYQWCAEPVKEEGQQLRYRQGNLAYTASVPQLQHPVRILPRRAVCWITLGAMKAICCLTGASRAESYQMVDGWPELTEQILNDSQYTPAKLSPFTGTSTVYIRWIIPSVSCSEARLLSLPDGEVDENIAALDLWSSNANGSVRAGLPSTTMLTEEASEYASTYNAVHLCGGNVLEIHHGHGTAFKL